MDNYYPDLITILSKYNIASFKDKLIEHLITFTNVENRKLIAGLLSTLKEKIRPDAVELLNGKTIHHRISGAMILSKLKDEESQHVLLKSFNEEKNEDTRDVIVETLYETVYHDACTIDDIKQSIHFAEKRGKLKNAADKNIDETTLPKLYWKDGQILTEKEVRFLLYRIQRSKGLNSDLEARAMIKHLDNSRSDLFAKHMIKLFIDSECNTKLKHFITLAAVVGGNDATTQLNTLFRKALADKRGRVAEIAIEGMTVIGTNKALRSLEVISRKMANKKPKLSEKALESLKAAASELSISMDELSDRIIPDFDFEGLYKSFEVEGEEYRAFINSDFVLCYLDEDNKMRKSLPKNVDKETKTQFTEIGKEVKEIVKMQEGKMLQFLIEQRKWSSEHWMQFYLQNPVMFIYAMKLLWVVFDAE
ncbi:MAG: hypothetical protein RLZZ546_62, partial [Bacteroidota bacterium]